MRLNKANQFFENKGISIVDFYINAKTPFYRCTVYKNERHLIRFKTFYKFIKKHHFRHYSWKYLESINIGLKRITILNLTF